MAHIPLEDGIADIIGKAQRGLGVNDEELSRRAEVSIDDINALKSGKPLTAVARRIARHLQLNPSALEAFIKTPPYPRVQPFRSGFMMFNTPYEDMTVNSYLVWDPRSRQAAAFDTGTDCAGMFDIVEIEKLDLRYIFITHTHEDHIADIKKLSDKAPLAEIWSSEAEPLEHPRAKTFRENAHFHIGSLAVKTLLTPGHSAGMTTYYISGLGYPLAIVGDSLFSCSTGGSETHFREQIKNNRAKIFTLPRDTVLACGHGPLTTLEFERAHNPFYLR